MPSRRFRNPGFPMSFLPDALIRRRNRLLQLPYRRCWPPPFSLRQSQPALPHRFRSVRSSTRIPQSPGVLADESAIEEAIQAVRAARDQTGLGYTYSNSFGPANQIVINRVDNFVVRYAQRGGLELPLGGSKIAQQLAVLSAQEREQIALIALHETRRERLAQLRNAYVQYWSYLNEASVSQSFVDTSHDAQSKGEVLRRSGFWTANDLLDLLTSIQKVQSEAESFRSSARGQFALIESAIGAEIPVFTPVAPTFFQNCNPDRARAIESAYRVDTSLAEYAAQAVQVREQLARIHGATINGSANAQAGSVTDINHRISGYSLDVGVNASFPTHARDEERALRAQYEAQQKTLGLRESQRRIELSSSVDSILDDIAGSRTVLAQAIADRNAREADVRNAIVRYNTLRQTTDTAFNDVNQKRSELYVAQRAVAEAGSALLLKASDLLMLAPAACGAPYDPMPVWTLSTPVPMSTHAPSAAAPSNAASQTKPTPSMEPLPARTSNPAPTPMPTPSSSPMAAPQSQMPSAAPSPRPTTVATPAVILTPSAGSPKPSIASPKPSVAPSPTSASELKVTPALSPSSLTIPPATTLPNAGTTPKPSVIATSRPSLAPNNTPSAAAMPAAHGPIILLPGTATSAPAKPAPQPTGMPKPMATSVATPSPKPTPSATPSPKPTPSATPSPKPTPSATPSPKPTPSATPSPKPTPTTMPNAGTPSPKPPVIATSRPSLAPNNTPSQQRCPPPTVR